MNFVQYFNKISPVNRIWFRVGEFIFALLEQAINYTKLLKFLIPENKVLNSLVFLISALITLNLFMFEYHQTAIIFYCTVWFLNKTQCSTTDLNKLVDEIINDPIKRNIYQEEIIKIVQSRYLLVNDSVNNYHWLNYLIKTKWAKSIRKIFQNEINQIAYSCFIDEKFSLKDNERTYRKWTKSNEILINKNLYRFDSLILKETKAPVLHEITKGTSIRKDEIVFQLRVQFWIDIIVHDAVKDEKKVIEDLEFLGSARLIFLPLLNKYPFIDGFTFWFNERVTFCTNSNLRLFDLKDADSTMLKKFIDQKVNQILFNLSYKVQARFNDEIIHQKTIFHSPIMLCYLNLIEIINLDNPNLSSNFTYFCLIRLGENVHHTRSIKNTVSPKFNEIFMFPVHDLYQFLMIKLFVRRHEHESSVCIGKLRINLPIREENVNDVDTYLKSCFEFNTTFIGKSIWLPFKVKNQNNRLPFINLKITLMNLTTDCSKFIDRTLVQFSKNQPVYLPVILIKIALTNINLDYCPNKQLLPSKLNREQLIRIFANLNGNYQFGRQFFVKNNLSIMNGVREAKFDFICNSSIQSTLSDLTFEIELLNTSGSKEIVPGKATVKLKELFSNGKLNVSLKSLAFQTPKLNKQLNPVNYGTVELHLTAYTVLIDDLVLDNLLLPGKSDECSKPQIMNAISYFSSYEKQKQMNLNRESDEFVPDLQFKTNKNRKARESLKQSKLIPTEQQVEHQTDEKDDCEILLVFHYPSNQLLLVDVIRLINIPVFSRNCLPNPTLLIEMWKDKSRVAYSLTETKYQTRDPFFSIQVQFEISTNKLSNLFLRIMVLEHEKKTFISRDRSQFLAESFIRVPELEIGNSSEPRWYKLTRIGIY